MLSFDHLSGIFGAMLAANFAFTFEGVQKYLDAIIGISANYEEGTIAEFEKAIEKKYRETPRLKITRSHFEYYRDKAKEDFKKRFSFDNTSFSDLSFLAGVYCLVALILNSFAPISDTAQDYFIVYTSIIFSAELLTLLMNKFYGGRIIPYNKITTILFHILILFIVPIGDAFIDYRSFILDSMVYTPFVEDANAIHSFKIRYTIFIMIICFFHFLIFFISNITKKVRGEMFLEQERDKITELL